MALCEFTDQAVAHPDHPTVVHLKKRLDYSQKLKLTDEIDPYSQELIDSGPPLVILQMKANYNTPSTATAEKKQTPP